ncbi:ferric reductase-like transmembrane domain-containing protein [Candidatus Azambacteria bacterium]|nr:ferric reductase-like transmembrane domain-containing protein [Candidatus Azambacteria bacterium]
MNLRKFLTWSVLWVISFFPVLIWFLYQPTTGKFSDVFSFFGSLAQISGLVGMAMFSVVLVLSARFVFVEKAFGGLDKLYKAHHILGGLAFSFLLFHPVFSAIKLAQISFSAALSLFFPSNNNALNFGIFSLLAMIILLVITFYANFKYNTWKWTHKFLGLAFLFAIAHTLLIPSDVSRSGFLKYYILTLAVFGVLAYSYRTLFQRRLVKKYKYTVSEVRLLGDNVFEITMQPKGAAMKFVSGQFIFISFLDDLLGREAHPFSLVSSPSEGFLKISVKSLGDFTAKLGKLQAGTEAEIEGPFGGFSYGKYGHKEQIWIAGGIGITPFLSMLSSIGEKSEYKVDLYYCVKNKGEAVYIPTFEKWKNPNVRIIPFYSDESGFINAGIIEKESSGVLNKDILLCGPPGMMNALKDQFLDRGVKIKNIHYEEFKLV